MPPAVERFPALEGVPGLVGGFVLRDPAIDVAVERNKALSRLAAGHRAALDSCGLAGMPLAVVTQIHGNKVLDCDDANFSSACEADAVVTTTRHRVLGIHVADCAAVFIVDRLGRGIALAHSGRQGTALGIVTRTIESLCARSGACPADLVLQISPCIGPPDYEIDFAAEILSQAIACGVHDCIAPPASTATNLQRYYSYRIEKGRTGRHLAFAALVSR
jgi:copper oxidase (laccase) domain-containing protein